MKKILIITAIIAIGFASCTKERSPIPETVNSIAAAQPPAGFTSKYATVNGVKIHYVVGGQGTPLLLIHGWPQNWYEWHRIMPDLATRYTVIVPDMRGIGESDKPLGTANYTKKVMAEDMHQLIRSLGYTSTYVAGHDIGGMVAYAYASKYPSEVSKVAIMEAPLPGIEPFWTQIKSFPTLWHFGLNSEQGTEDIIVGNERAYLTNIFTKFSTGISNFRADELDEFTRAYTGKDALRGGFEWYRAFNNTDTLDNRIFSQVKLNMPVLTVGGEYVLGGAMGPMLQSVSNPNRVTPLILTATAHFIMEEKPNEVLTALKNFFN
jgi:pimeloyl-ACP methyl ester carboxylesterase